MSYRHLLHAPGAVRLALAAALVAGTASLLGLETLVKRDGGRAAAPQFQFDNGTFTGVDGAAAGRNEVSDWWLTEAPATETAATAAGTPPTAPEAATVKAEMERYREQGQAMAARFPGSKGVQILDDGQYVLTADHRHVYRYHFVGLILNEAVLNWSQIDLSFSEGRSRETIRFARSLSPDGRLFTLDPKDIKVSRPGQEAVFFDPNNRVVTATVPGAEVGSVVEYAYEYENYAPEDWRLFFPSFYFQSDWPVCDSVFTVQVPADQPLYSWEEHWGREGGLWSWCTAWLPSAWHRPFATRTVEDAGARYREYKWRKLDVPPVTAEPGMPPMADVTPGVHASLMKDWDHLNRLTGDMQRERMKPTPEIEAKVRELTAGCTTVDGKIARLYHWVQKNIRYISVKSSLSSGWSGHPAGETFTQGYGDCTDKAVLFCTMLHLIGLESEPIVLRTNDMGVFVPKYPVLACNHCITEVRIGDRRLYLDSTAQDERYPALRADDHGVLAINFVRGERRLIPVPTGLDGMGRRLTEAMVLDLDGALHVRARSDYGGLYESALRAGWKRVPEKLRRQVMQQHLNGIAPGARLEEFTLPDPQNLEEPFRLEYRYTLPEYVSVAGSLRLFQVPDRERTFPEVSLETRRYPLDYTTSEGAERTVAVELPAGLRVVELPPDVRIHNRYVTYTEAFRQADSHITFESRYERRDRRIPTADYAAYRQALQHIEEATRKVAYLEVVPEPAAAADPAPR